MGSPWNVVDVDEFAALSCQDKGEANVFCCHFCHFGEHLLQIGFVDLQMLVLVSEGYKSLAKKGPT